MLVIDGRGAKEATTLWHAQDGRIRLLEQYDYPNSIGVFYAGITQMLGFVPLSDEWKVMGLASYGQPTFDLSPLMQARGTVIKFPAVVSSAGRILINPGSKP